MYPSLQLTMNKKLKQLILLYESVRNLSLSFIVSLHLSINRAKLFISLLSNSFSECQWIVLCCVTKITLYELLLLEYGFNFLFVWIDASLVQGSEGSRGRLFRTMAGSMHSASGRGKRRTQQNASCLG